MNNLNVYVGCELDVAGQKVTFESVKYTDGPKKGQPKTAINKIKMQGFEMQMNVGDGKDPLKLGSIDDIANYFGFDKQSMGKENDQLEVNINTALSKLGKFTDVPYKMAQLPHQALKYTKEDDTIYCVAEADFGFTQQNPTAISRTLADKVIATKTATTKAKIEADQLSLSKGHYLVGTASEFEITADKKIPIKEPTIKTLHFTDDDKTIDLQNFAASDTDQYINKVKQSAWYNTETVTKKYNNADRDCINQASYKKSWNDAHFTISQTNTSCKQISSSI